jgi:hypothetical protein
MRIENTDYVKVETNRRGNYIDTKIYKRWYILFKYL